nr:MAG TPA_asm: hypothetical protein [Caudoviricetes sp.]
MTSDILCGQFVSPVSPRQTSAVYKSRYLNKREL